MLSKPFERPLPNISMKRAADIWRRLWRGLPRGGSLPEEVWERRHRGITVVLWLHVIGLALFAMLSGYAIIHSIAEVSAVAVAALIAGQRHRARIVRASAAAFGLLTASALLVHFSGGLIEMHFHFFVMVGVITLYQDWIPFLVAIGYVVVHHGFLGTLHPEIVFNHPAAHENPWGWAGIHGLFIVAASAAQLTAWRLNEEGYLDSLTSLPNRNLFADRVEHAMARGRRDGTPLSVLFLDLDEFKTINDSLGHAAGDRVLLEVADRLRRLLRESDSGARLGGDEFAVLLENTDLAGAERVAERILQSLRRPHELQDREVFLSVSIGVVAVRDQETSHDVLRDADVAMYMAKAAGRDRYKIFEPGMHARALSRLELHTELKHAITHDEFVLHYQPTVDLVTGRIYGVEALVRWRHPRRGLLPPSEFIPMAEETGLIISIGKQVLRHACIQARDWQRAFPSDPPLAIKVNLSGRQLHHPGIIDHVKDALEESGLPPETLVLEMTETVLMHDAEATSRTLHALKEIGVRLAIDDFGTGYSSFSYLRQFPIDILKIDKSFVNRISHGPEDAAVARAIVKLGHTLGMTTVGEGIELPDQALELTSMGCDLGQGFLYSTPRSADEIAAVLDRGVANGIDDRQRLATAS